MIKFKSFGYYIVLFVIIFTSEAIRQALDIPVTILDITLTPLAVFILFLFLRTFFIDKKAKKKINAIESIPLTKSIGMIMSSILLLALGWWGIWAGALEPLKLFTGVKGAGHGYTLVVIGLIIVLMGISVLWVAVWSLFISTKK